MNAKMYVSLAIQVNKRHAKLMLRPLMSASIVVITFKMLSVEIMALCYYYYKFVHTFS